MKKFLWLAIFILFSVVALGQTGFEVLGLQENYRGIIGETIKAPLRVKNTSDKAITLIIRKISIQIGSTQRNYFCLDSNCLDQRNDDVVLRIDPGLTLNSLQIALEGGLVPGESNAKYLIFNKQNGSGDFFEFEVNFVTEEKPEKHSIYNSRRITLHDVYPNPVNDHAFVDYKILNERAKARIVIHNILGNVVGEYTLPFAENKVKIRTEELNSGIYFYTLYIDNEGVLTRKLIVKK